jgi:membrane protein YdbS with pleckstrin-like domain
MSKPEDDGTAADRFRDAIRHNDAEEETEEELWQGRYSGKAMVGYWIGSAILVVVVAIVAFMSLTFGRAILTLLTTAVVVWSGLFLLLTCRKWSNSYRLTSQRLIHKTGLLRQVTDRIEVLDMDDVTYEQGIVERFLSVGTIHISSSDRSHPILDLQGIDEVQRIADLIDDLRRNERRKRAVHIEAI